MVAKVGRSAPGELTIARGDLSISFQGWKLEGITIKGQREKDVVSRRRRFSGRSIPTPVWAEAPAEASKGPRNSSTVSLAPVLATGSCNVFPSTFFPVEQPQATAWPRTVTRPVPLGYISITCTLAWAEKNPNESVPAHQGTWDANPRTAFTKRMLTPNTPAILLEKETRSPRRGLCLSAPPLSAPPRPIPASPATGPDRSSVAKPKERPRGSSSASHRRRPGRHRVPLTVGGLPSRHRHLRSTGSTPLAWSGWSPARPGSRG